MIDRVSSFQHALGAFESSVINGRTAKPRADSVTSGNFELWMTSYAKVK